VGRVGVRRALRLFGTTRFDVGSAVLVLARHDRRAPDSDGNRMGAKDIPASPV
jgi:hypothetical protein